MNYKTLNQEEYFSLSRRSNCQLHSVKASVLPESPLLFVQSYTTQKYKQAPLLLNQMLHIC